MRQVFMSKSSEVLDMLERPCSVCRDITVKDEDKRYDGYEIGEEQL